MSSTSNIAKQVVSELESVQAQLTKFKSGVAYLTDAKAQIDSASKALNTNEKSLALKLGEFERVLSDVNELKDASQHLVQKIDGINFPERLQRIEEIIKETILQIEKTRKASVIEIEILTKQVKEVDFKGNFDNLKKVVDTSAKNNQLVIDILDRQDLPQRIFKFQESIESHVSKGLNTLSHSNQKINSDTLKVIQDLNFALRMDKLDANVAGIQSSVMTVVNKTDHLERDIREQFSNLRLQLEGQHKTLRARQSLVLTIIILIAFGTATGFYLLSHLF